MLWPAGNRNNSFGNYHAHLTRWFTAHQLCARTALCWLPASPEQSTARTVLEAVMGLPQGSTSCPGLSQGLCLPGTTGRQYTTMLREKQAVHSAKALAAHRHPPHHQEAHEEAAAREELKRRLGRLVAKPAHAEVGSEPKKAGRKDKSSDKNMCAKGMRGAKGKTGLDGSPRS